MSGVPYGIVYLTARYNERGVAVKFYVGQHRLTNGVIEDGYMGSGNLIRNALKKYKKESFSRLVLELCYSNEELNEKEELWIKKFDAVNNKSFYNLSEGCFGAARKIRKKVYQYTLAGKFVAEHESVAAASLVAGCAPAQMTQTCKSPTRTCKGFQWRFEYRESYPSMRKGHERSVYCYTSSGEFVCGFSTVTEAANFIGQKTTGNICSCCKDGKLEAGGYQWRYEKLDKIAPTRRRGTSARCIYQVDSKTGEVLAKFDSFGDASKAIGQRQGNLCSSANTGRLAGGFLWSYSEDTSEVMEKRKAMPGKLCRKVDCYDRDWNFVRSYPSSESAAKDHGINRSNILNVCAGRQSSAADHYWKYAS